MTVPVEGGFPKKQAVEFFLLIGAAVIAIFLAGVGVVKFVDSAVMAAIGTHVQNMPHAGPPGPAGPAVQIGQPRRFDARDAQRSHRAETSGMVTVLMGGEKVGGVEIISTSSDGRMDTVAAARNWGGGKSGETLVAPIPQGNSWHIQLNDGGPGELEVLWHPMSDVAASVEADSYKLLKPREPYTAETTGLVVVLVTANAPEFRIVRAWGRIRDEGSAEGEVVAGGVAIDGENQPVGSIHASSFMMPVPKGKSWIIETTEHDAERVQVRWLPLTVRFGASSTQDDR